MKEINDDANQDDENANTDDPFTSLAIHNKTQIPSSKKQINKEIRKDNLYQDYKQYFLCPISNCSFVFD